MTWQCPTSPLVAPRLNMVKAIPLRTLCACLTFNGAALPAVFINDLNVDP